MHTAQHTAQPFGFDLFGMVQDTSMRKHEKTQTFVFELFDIFVHVFLYLAWYRIQHTSMMRIIFRLYLFCIDDDDVDGGGGDDVNGGDNGGDGGGGGGGGDEPQHYQHHRHSSDHSIPDDFFLDLKLSDLLLFLNLDFPPITPLLIAFCIEK